MEHPTLTHNLTDVFQLALEFRLLPDRVLAMDGELYLQFREYLAGYGRGQEIARARP